MATIAVLLAILGVILVVLGYTMAPAARMPGWACLAIAIILLLIFYMVPVGAWQ